MSFEYTKTKEEIERHLAPIDQRSGKEEATLTQCGALEGAGVENCPLKTILEKFKNEERLHMLVIDNLIKKVDAFMKEEGIRK